MKKRLLTMAKYDRYDLAIVTLLIIMGVVIIAASYFLVSYWFPK